MTAFRAIVKLTCRNSLRSHVFQFLLVVLLLGVVIVPNTIKGDGSAYGFIQVSLEYSMSFITAMLVLSGLWLGCQTMTFDVWEGSQLHMIVVKPVSHVTIWLGKLTGVVLTLTALLLISSAAVYMFVTWQYGKLSLVSDEKTEKTQIINEQNAREKARIDGEVLTGRRVYMPVQPDIDKIVNAEFSRKLAEVTPDGRKVLDITDAKSRDKALKELRRQTIARLAEVKPGETKGWKYEGLPKKITDPEIYLRYRAYSGSIDATQNQSVEFGAWGVLWHYFRKPDPAATRPGTAAEPEVVQQYMPRQPEQLLCSSVNEMTLPSDVVVYDGEALIGFTNLSPSRNSVFFQLADGPKLLVKETGFFGNYCRAVAVQFLAVLAASLIGVALASFMSMPTAVFISMCYLALGTFSLFMLGAEDMYGDDMPFTDAVGYNLSRLLLLMIIPLQKFSVSTLVANGELVEFSLIGSILLFQVILKGVPLAVAAVLLYRNRELALATNKR